MDETQKAAYVFSQSICAMAEIEAMKATNRQREMDGAALAYNENHFMAIPDKYDIGYNAVIALFREI